MAAVDRRFLEERIKEGLSVSDFLLWRGRLEDKVMPIVRTYINEEQRLLVLREHEANDEELASGDMATHSSEFGLIERGEGGWVGSP